jgi:hypothetical protein
MPVEVLMTKAERETVIRWDSEDEMAEVYTMHTRLRNRIEKAGVARYKVDRNNGREVAWWYRIPLAKFRVSFLRAV